MAKRLFDIIFSLLGLVILAPVFICIAIIIKLTSKGTVLYRAKRVGKDHALFTLFKFRTMVEHAENTGPGITASDDQRITHVGGFLRRSKLDETPQLLNVLLGTMSIVGPRPEDPRYAALYTQEQSAVLTVKPGMTSLASIQFRHEEQMLSGSDWENHYINEIMPSKLVIDLEYIHNASFLLDIKIIALTFLALFR